MHVPVSLFPNALTIDKVGKLDQKCGSEPAHQ